MKTFQQGTKQYEVGSKWMELPVEKLAEKLTATSATMQMVAIDTIFQIIARDEHFLGGNPSVFVQQICNGQRERVAHFGDKAFGMSDKQIACVAAEIDRLTSSWVEELA